MEPDMRHTQVAEQLAKVGRDPLTAFGGTVGPCDHQIVMVIGLTGGRHKALLLLLQGPLPQETGTGDVSNRVGFGVLACAVQKTDPIGTIDLFLRL